MKKTAILLLLVLLSVLGFSQTANKSKHYNLEKGVGIQGYDPVAYFKEGKAKEGKKSISYTYEGVTYYFTNETYRDLFKKSPASYEPQYGGWCAYAMGATGEKVEIDPETFKITNGKLYLFYNAYFNNTLPKWNKDETNLKSKADGNWTKMNK